MTSKTYTISELAREFDITPRTIRFYEEKGYLQPHRVGQRRLYSAADRVRIRLILRGKRIGLSLAESVEIIDMYQPGAGNATQLSLLIERIEERREKLRQQLNDIDAMLNNLAEVESACRDALQTQLEKPRPRRSERRQVTEFEQESP